MPTQHAPIRFSLFCMAPTVGKGALACLLAANGFAQEKAKEKAKSYTFHGKVEAVTDKGLTVNGEKVEGWMDAMTMTYKVDNPVNVVERRF
jgi:hypothetical protein